MQGDEPPRLLAGHTNTVSTVAFAPDGQSVLSGAGDGTLLASASEDGTVRLWGIPE